jgi:hypothetical protein
MLGGSLILGPRERGGYVRDPPPSLVESYIIDGGRVVVGTSVCAVYRVVDRVPAQGMGIACFVYRTVN